jgi:hypothetical protein
MINQLTAGTVQFFHIPIELQIFKYIIFIMSLMAGRLCRMLGWLHPAIEWLARPIRSFKHSK